MQLKILGSGDAFSSGGRLPSCYILKGGDSQILLDCGPAILIGLKEAGISGNSLSHIFISHLHGDHFAGVPFFLIDAIFPSSRSTPLTLVGPPGLEERIMLTCEVFYPSLIDQRENFELNFIEIEKEVPRQIAGYSVTPYEVEHFSGSPSYALRFERDGKVFAFSGDSGWTDNLISAGKAADAYLMECYHPDRELPMHLNYKTISEKYTAIGAKKIILTHMSEAMLENLDIVDKDRFMLAEDGLTVDF